MAFASDRTSVKDEYDDLLDALDYFDNIDNIPSDRRRSVLSATQPAHSAPTVSASTNFAAETSADQTETTPQVSESVGTESTESPNRESSALPEPSGRVGQRDQWGEAWGLAGPTPWASVRSQSVATVDLVEFYPEAWGSDFLRPGLAEPDDLSEDKIEREVHALELSSDDRAEMRSLLREFRQNTTRAQIMALLERGRTPREIRQIARVRLRCQAIFTEFPRVDLFGTKFAAGHNETIGWKLAETLYLAGLFQRGELFRFFRSLCDQLSGFADREDLARGAISLATHQLTYPRDLVHSLIEMATPQGPRRVRQLLAGRDWPGESSDVWKPVEPLRILGWARSREHTSRTPKWNSGFREYVQADRARTGEGNALELLCCILQIESPVSLVYLDRRLRSAGAPRGKTLELVADLSFEGLVTRVGQDVWWASHYQYFSFRKCWVPRLPRNFSQLKTNLEICSPYAPSLLESPILDVGYALTSLRAQFSGEQWEKVATLFFQRWGSFDRDFRARQERIKQHLDEYHDAYGKVLT